MAIRVVVTGGREFDDQWYIDETLDAIHDDRRIVQLAHGGARGADRCAADWAHRAGIPALIEYRADWDGPDGNRAGMVRNVLMLHHEAPHLLVAFPGGTGTAHCVHCARELGIPVYEA